MNLDLNFKPITYAFIAAIVLLILGSSVKPRHYHLGSLIQGAGLGVIIGSTVAVTGWPAALFGGKVLYGSLMGGAVGFAVTPVFTTANVNTVLPNAVTNIPVPAQPNPQPNPVLPAQPKR